MQWSYACPIICFQGVIVKGLTRSILFGIALALAALLKIKENWNFSFNYPTTMEEGRWVKSNQSLGYNIPVREDDAVHRKKPPSILRLSNASVVNFVPSSNSEININFCPLFWLRLFTSLYWRIFHSGIFYLYTDLLTIWLSALPLVEALLANKVDIFMCYLIYAERSNSWSYTNMNSFSSQLIWRI